MSSSGLSILLIEDSDLLAGSTSRELEREYGHDVTWLRDPTLMTAKLSERRFDVAIVDVLYEHLNREFDARRLAGQVKIRGEQLLITGLTAIHILSQQLPAIGTVVWTIGEANRRLHLLYAYENLGIRNYCSKSPGTGDFGTLEYTARIAPTQQQYVDPVLNPYLPVTRARRATDILLKDDCKRAIWRAMAVGAAGRTDIARIAGYSDRTVGNRMPEMYQDLLEFDPGLPPSRAPQIEVARYAASNWQFFLDEAVRRMYP